MLIPMMMNDDDNDNGDGDDDGDDNNDDNKDDDDDDSNYVYNHIALTKPFISYLISIVKKILLRYIALM